MKLQKQIITWFSVLTLLLLSGIFLSTYGMDYNNSSNDTQGYFLNCTNLEGTFNENSQKLLSIRNFFLDLRRHDAKQLEQLLSDDVTFIITGRVGMVPLAGTYNGKTEVERYISDFRASLYDAQMIFQYNLASPEYINTHVQLIAKVRETGKTMNVELVYNWMLNDEGKIKFLELYYDTYTWYTAFQPGGCNYVEDIKGEQIEFQPVNFDTVQFITELYSEFDSGNITAVLNDFDDNLVFVLKGDTNCVYPGKYYGKTGFMQFLQNLTSVAYYTQPDTILHTIPQGNHIDVLLHEELIWRATGKSFASDLCHSIVVSDDGKLLAFTSYNDSFEVYYASLP